MPTYEYVCTDCATPLEVVASFSDPPLTHCPTCGGRLRKVFGNVGVVFKGSGFYRNDSRGKKSGSAPATTGSSSEKGSSDKKSSDKSPSDKSGVTSGSATSDSSAAGSSSGASSSTPKPAGAKPAVSTS